MKIDINFVTKIWHINSQIGRALAEGPEYKKESENLNKISKCYSLIPNILAANHEAI